MMRRRVLMVVSSYRPIMIADMQRVRMLTWVLPSLGWDCEVLTPGSGEVRQDALEPEPRNFFPEDVPVHEVGSFGAAALTAIGSGTHGWRTFIPMYRMGSELLASSRFDLVYCSTTMFAFFLLARVWKRKFRVPYVLDFHDPWVRDNGKRNMNRSGWRSRLVDLFGIWMERVAVVGAGGLVAVSPNYVAALRRRYQCFRPPWLQQGRNAVIAFGALDGDLLEAKKTAKLVKGGSNVELAIHYVGAGGAIMARSFAMICRALALLRSQGNLNVERVRLSLLGTMYGWKPGEPRHLQRVAQDAGVGDLVTEIPDRVSYRRSVELLLEGDGVLVLGVDDVAYMPSKLYGYALSGKPLLAAVHREGPAFAEFLRTPELGHAIWFSASGEMPLGEAAKVVSAFLQETAERRSFDRRSILEPFLAQAMAKRHSELFDQCLAK